MNLRDRIDWPRQRDALHHLRAMGAFPASHSSHDSFNEQIAVPISSTIKQEWTQRFESLQKVRNGEGETVFVLADGFLMLSDEESVKEFDVRLFVRESEETVKRRRVERSGYVSYSFPRLL